jgi:hypothetical protein
MGQYKEQRQKDSGQAGMTALVVVSLLSAWSTTLHMNGITSACRLTVPLATTANKSPCPLVRKGVKGDLGGAGDRIWFYLKRDYNVATQKAKGAWIPVFTGMTDKKDSGDPRQARTGSAGMTENGPAPLRALHTSAQNRIILTLGIPNIIIGNTEQEPIK